MSIFKWFKKPSEGGVASDAEIQPTDSQAPVSAESPKVSLFTRLKQGLTKTGKALGSSLAAVLLGRKSIDAELLEEIESVLIGADVGIEVSNKIVEDLTQQSDRQTLKDPAELMPALKTHLLNIAKPVEQPLVIDNAHRPFVILVVGVNGAGKTTTIGKLAKRLQSEGKSVLLAAGDTFRAAAVEQLQVWGERNHIPVIAQHMGADSASVIFDALSAAKARNIDVVIADTAGRLHTKHNLMDELVKVKRVIQKFDLKAPHETLLVLDAGNGQNALVQAMQFHQAIHISGIVLTKLDGTAKGGILFAISDKLHLPIRFIGVGEHIDDLRPFHAEEFVEALFQSVALSD